MFRAVFGNRKEGGGGGGKKKQKNAGVGVHTHSTLQRDGGGGSGVGGRHARHHQEHKGGHGSSKPMRLTRGVSISLPSSPLLPRPADMAPSPSCVKFPGRAKKLEYVEDFSGAREPLVFASCRGKTHHRDLHVEPQLGSSLSTQELMTRLCFLLGEATPGTASSPMEDRMDKKCDSSTQGGSPSSTLTCSTASPCSESPSSTLSVGAGGPHPTQPLSLPSAQCGSGPGPGGTLSSPGPGLAPGSIGGSSPGPPTQPSPTSTLESKDSGIIATITSSSENDERSGSTEVLTKDEGPAVRACARDGPGGALQGEGLPRSEIAEPRTPPAPKRPLPQHHLHGTSSLAMPRPNSVAATSSTRLEDLSFLDNQRAAGHRSSVRKHCTAGRVSDDSKGRLVALRQADIMLKPLLFEVPGITAETPFVGRDWLFTRLEEVLRKSSSCEGRGAVIVGNAGSGKTAIMWRLVTLSGHGTRTPLGSANGGANSGDVPHSPGSSPKCGGGGGGASAKGGSRQQAAESQPNLSAAAAAAGGGGGGGSDGAAQRREAVRSLAAKVVAYHFCQADNTYTCLVPEFVHSVAALLARAPQLGPYRELLVQEPHLQNTLSLRSCVQDPTSAFRKGVLEPLASLRKERRLLEEDYIILVDSLNEAEFHKPDYGDTIATFITKIISKFPSWLKLVVTVRTGLVEITTLLPFSGISLDILPDSSDLGADLSDYIHHRVGGSAQVAANVTTPTGSAPDPLLLSKFCSHLSTRSHGSVLYLQLTLDLFHKGHLALKGGNYLVVPVSLSEVYLLMCRVSFPDKEQFERILPVLNVALASLHPLTDEQMFRALNAGSVRGELEWKDFQQRLDSLAGFMVRRRDGTRMLCHPSFREWLVWRADGESTDFLCDPRSGHALLAFMFSRQEGKLNRQQTMELGHHILKAHIFKGLSKKTGVSSSVLQAMWVNCSTDSLSAALASLRNLYTPNIKVSRLLMLGGASVTWCTEVVGRAPILAVHAHLGHVEMVALLLEMWAPVDGTAESGMTPLCLAAAAGHVDIVSLLCKKGAKVGHADKNGQCALVHAGLKGHVEIMTILLGQDWGAESGADPQQHNGSSSTSGGGEAVTGRTQAAQQALTAAASVGHTQVVRSLLDLKDEQLAVQMDAHDSLWGETVLSAAAGRGRMETCAFLLERGAGLEIPNRRGMVPLLSATKHGHTQVAELLLKQDADINVSDKQGRTTLMWAASEGHNSTVELLLSKGASLSSVDQDGLSPLSWACLKGHKGAMQLLVEAGVDLNQADRQGRTPLDLAALNGDADMVHCLVEHGALMERADNGSNRGSERPGGCQNPALVASLLKKGSKTGYRTSAHDRSGHATWAMASSKPDILLILLQKLMEEGNMLYKKGRMKEAGQRYQYALRKLPREGQGEELKGLKELRVSLYLNLSRCRRKTNDFGIAEDFATKALELKPRSYEAFYARARAKRSSRQFAAALADLHEAARLSPSNREIRRLLSRVEEECVHHQKAAGGNSTPGYGRDPYAHHHHQGGEDEPDAFSHGSLERQVPAERGDGEREEDKEDGDEVSLPCWPLNPYAPNRTLPGGVAYALHDQSPAFPQEDYAQNQMFVDLPEPVPPANRQSQSSRTYHHCHSLQSGGRVGGRPLSLCGPSSPLPGRHISTSLRPAPPLGIDMGPGSVSEHCGHSPTELFHPMSPGSSSPPGPLHMYQPRAASFSRGSERLSAQNAPLDGLALALGSGMEVRRESGGAGTAGSRGSSSSQASSGNMSDGGRQQVLDAPCPIKSSGSFKSKPELKPRPFMGVMDKSVRVQGQQTSGRQGQGGGGVESFGMSVMEFQGLNNDFKRSSFQEPLCGGQAGGGQQQGRDFGERLHQREARSSTSSQLRFPEGRHRQTSLTRDNPALHMAPIKPKRSFIESNV